jgi:hypothetical protein
MEFQLSSCHIVWAKPTTPATGTTIMIEPYRSDVLAASVRRPFAIAEYLLDCIVRVIGNDCQAFVVGWKWCVVTDSKADIESRAGGRWKPHPYISERFRALAGFWLIVLHAHNHTRLPIRPATVRGPGAGTGKSQTPRLTFVLPRRERKGKGKVHKSGSFMLRP